VKKAVWEVTMHLFAWYLIHTLLFTPFYLSFALSKQFPALIVGIRPVDKVMTEKIRTRDWEIRFSPFLIQL
jgi:hypothetical protein